MLSRTFFIFFKFLTFLKPLTLSTSLICFLIGSQTFAGEIPQLKSSVCKWIKPVYQHSILKKIKSGVPFELMSLFTYQKQIQCRKILHITFDLWDEIITVKEQEKIISKFKLKKGLGALCPLLICKNLSVPSNNKMKFRLLLNPMWQGRLKRLQGIVPMETKNRRAGIIHINWSNIGSGLPNKQLLIEKVFP